MVDGGIVLDAVCTMAACDGMVFSMRVCLISSLRSVARLRSFWMKGSHAFCDDHGGNAWESPHRLRSYLA